MVSADGRCRPTPTASRPRSSRAWRAATGRALLLQRPADGPGRASSDFGEHHLETGELILYTSQDSVLQLAAHDDVVPAGRAATRSARRSAAMMTGAARRRPRDRPAVHRRARAPSRAPTGAATSRSTPPSRSYARRAARRRRAGPRRRQGAPTCSPGAASTERHPGATTPRRSRTTAPARRARRRAWSSPTSSTPTRSTAIARTSRASTRALREIDAAVAGWLERAARRRPADPHRRPRRRPASPRTATTRASTSRCSRSARRRRRRHDGRDGRRRRARPTACSPGATPPACLDRALPELPEVETIRRQLAPARRGPRPRRAGDPDPRWCAPLAPEELEDARQGRRVERLGRRGKYLVWELDGDVFLLMHLRMTGTLLLDPPAGTPYAPRALRAGRRARAALLRPAPLRHRRARALGPRRWTRSSRRASASSRWARSFTAERLRALARGRRAPVKAFLLDQRQIAGVGNIYADEALFRARIHPLRAGGQADARAARRAARGGRRRAERGHRRRRRDDRRLPPCRRRRGRLPGRVPRPPARGASRARAAAGRCVKMVAAGPRDLRVRDLPAAAAAPRPSGPQRPRTAGGAAASPPGKAAAAPR